MWAKDGQLNQVQFIKFSIDLYWKIGRKDENNLLECAAVQPKTHRVQHFKFNQLVLHHIFGLCTKIEAHFSSSLAVEVFTGHTALVWRIWFLQYEDKESSSLLQSFQTHPFFLLLRRGLCCRKVNRRQLNPAGQKTDFQVQYAKFSSIIVSTWHMISSFASNTPLRLPWTLRSSALNSLHVACERFEPRLIALFQNEGALREDLRCLDEGGRNIVETRIHPGILPKGVSFLSFECKLHGHSFHCRFRWRSQIHTPHLIFLLQDNLNPSYWRGIVSVFVRNCQALIEHFFQKIIHENKWLGVRYNFASMLLSKLILRVMIVHVPSRTSQSISRASFESQQFRCAINTVYVFILHEQGNLLEYWITLLSLFGIVQFGQCWLEWI